MNIYIVIGIAVIVLLLLFFLVVFNKLIKFKNEINEAFATMDVYLKKRWDLIPNLIETVKGYAKHENETLKDIVSLRSEVYDNLSNDTKVDVNQKMQGQIGKLFALAENYPSLKADKNYLDLQKNLSLVEDEIAKSRKYYNGVIRDYNNLVESFPSNIVASICGYRIKPMFEAMTNERENIKVKL